MHLLIQEKVNYTVVWDGTRNSITWDWDASYSTIEVPEFQSVLLVILANIFCLDVFEYQNHLLHLHSQY